MSATVAVLLVVGSWPSSGPPDEKSRPILDSRFDRVSSLSFAPGYPRILTHQRVAGNSRELDLLVLGVCSKGESTDEVIYAYSDSEGFSAKEAETSLPLACPTIRPEWARSHRVRLELRAAMKSEKFEAPAEMERLGEAINYSELDLTMLDEAVAAGSGEAVKALLKAGANPSLGCRRYENVLLTGLEKGEVNFEAIARTLFPNAADVNQICAQGEDQVDTTLLSLAAERCMPRAAKFLLALGGAVPHEKTAVCRMATPIPELAALIAKAPVRFASKGTLGLSPPEPNRFRRRLGPNSRYLLIAKSWNLDEDNRAGRKKELERHSRFKKANLKAGFPKILGHADAPEITDGVKAVVLGACEDLMSAHEVAAATWSGDGVNLTIRETLALIPPSCPVVQPGLK